MTGVASAPNPPVSSVEIGNLPRNDTATRLSHFPPLEGRSCDTDTRGNRPSSSELRDIHVHRETGKSAGDAFARGGREGGVEGSDRRGTRRRDQRNSSLLFLPARSDLSRRASPPCRARLIGRVSDLSPSSSPESARAPMCRKKRDGKFGKSKATYKPRCHRRNATLLPPVSPFAGSILKPDRA